MDAAYELAGRSSLAIAGGDADLPATAAKVLTGGTTTRSRKLLDAASEQQVVQRTRRWGSVWKSKVQCGFNVRPYDSF